VKTCVQLLKILFLTLPIGQMPTLCAVLVSPCLPNIFISESQLSFNRNVSSFVVLCSVKCGEVCFIVIYFLLHRLQVIYHENTHGKQAGRNT